MVRWFAFSPAPAGWLFCNGSLVSRASYPALFLAIGEMYGAGDGVTTFGIPDLRGEFLRGADAGRGVDSGRAMGTLQGFQLQSHTHTVAVSNSTTGGTGLSAGSSGAYLNNNGYTAATGGTSNGSENRPRNVAMLPCIKY